VIRKEDKVKSADLGIIAVGQPYDPDTQTLPEGCHYNFDVSGHWLHYLYQNPTQIEIDSVQKGEAQFGLYTKGPILFLLHQFGAMAWNDAAYSWWLVSAEFRKLPEETDGVHALLKTIMVDTASALVKAIRACTFSAEFTTCLHDAIRRQTQKPWSKTEHEEAVRHIYSKYSTMDLVNMGEVFCKGGE
jgi:hypothetical protein